MNTTMLVHAPRVVHMGPNSHLRLSEHVKFLGGGRVLVVTDSGVAKAGLLGKIITVLEQSGIKHSVFTEVEPNPSIATVKLCLQKCMEYEANLVIAVGGGSAIDVAKSVATCSGNNGNISDFLGIDRIPSCGLPMIMIPTTAGSGSEASKAVVLNDLDEGNKKAAWSPHLMPDIVLIDPVLHLSMPKVITIDTGADALTHAIEAFTGKASCSLTDALAEKSIHLITRNLVTACRIGDFLPARERMAEAAFLAGLSFSNSGLGAIHALAYPLASICQLSHGRSNAMITPAVMRFNVRSNPKKFHKITRIMRFGVNENFGDSSESGTEAADEVERLLNFIGVETKLRVYGIKESDISEMAKIAVESGGRLLENNPRDISIKDAEKIYQEAY